MTAIQWKAGHAATRRFSATLRTRCLPFLGQGACAALEDAVELGKAVAKADDAQQAIEDYEAKRVAERRGSSRDLARRPRRHCCRPEPDAGCATRSSHACRLEFAFVNSTR